VAASWLEQEVLLVIVMALLRHNAAILHELAHNIKNAAGNGFLIPNDGKDTKGGLSPKNTELIRKKCAKEIFNGK
jgi:hypothetical protein